MRGGGGGVLADFAPMILDRQKWRVFLSGGVGFSNCANLVKSGRMEIAMGGVGVY